MRSVLITTAGLALLLAPTLAQALEIEKRLERVTTCEVFASVHESDLTLVDNLKLQRGGLHADFPAACAAIALERVIKLCKKYNRKDRNVPHFNFGYSFKIVQVNLNPPPSTCNGPSDPQCVDFLFDSFILTSIAADVQTGDCAQIMDR